MFRTTNWNHIRVFFGDWTGTLGLSNVYVSVMKMWWRFSLSLCIYHHFQIKLVQLQFYHRKEHLLQFVCDKFNHWQLNTWVISKHIYMQIHHSAQRPEGMIIRSSVAPRKPAVWLDSDALISTTVETLGSNGVTHDSQGRASPAGKQQHDQQPSSCENLTLGCVYAWPMLPLENNSVRNIIGCSVLYSSLLITDDCS